MVLSSASFFHFLTDPAVDLGVGVVVVEDGVITEEDVVVFMEGSVVDRTSFSASEFGPPLTRAGCKMWLGMLLPLETCCSISS